MSGGAGTRTVSAGESFRGKRYAALPCHIRPPPRTARMSVCRRIPPAGVFPERIFRRHGRRKGIPTGIRGHGTADRRSPAFPPWQRRIPLLSGGAVPCRIPFLSAAWQTAPRWRPSLPAFPARPEAPADRLRTAGNRSTAYRAQMQGRPSPVPMPTHRKGCQRPHLHHHTVSSIRSFRFGGTTDRDDDTMPVPKGIFGTAWHGRCSHRNIRALCGCCITDDRFPYMSCFTSLHLFLQPCFRWR